MMEVWIGFMWLWIGAVVGSCKHGNEPFSSINDGECLY
jgi:hypothetical protein